MTTAVMTSRRPYAVAIGLLATTGMGAAMALQTRGNGELGRLWQDPYAAALYSLSTGLLTIVLFVVATRSGRSGVAELVGIVRGRHLPVWTLLGGLVGASFVLSQAVVSPLLGVALFTIGTVAGQAIGGILVDRIGLGPSGVHKITPPRVVGALVMIVAVAWGASAQVAANAEVIAIVVPILIGVAMGFQQAGNGRVRTSTSVPIATLNNFAIGWAALALIFLVRLIFAGPPELASAPIWAYLGGVIGVGYIVVATVFVEVLGVLLLSLGTVAGQMLGSLVVDQVIPATPHALTFATIGSAILTVVAVAITALPAKSAE